MKKQIIPVLLFTNILLAACGTNAAEERKTDDDHDHSANEAVNDHGSDTTHADHDGHTHDGHDH